MDASEDLGEAVPAEGSTPPRRTRRQSKRRQRQAHATVAVLAGAAAVGGATAGCHPTATPVVDPLLAAALAALVTVAASRARRATWLIIAAVGVALSRGWVYLPAGAGFAVALASVWSRRRRQRAGALVGALAVQAMLRWPAVGFHGLTALVAAVLVAACLLSAWRQMGPTGRRRALWAGLGTAGVLVVLAVPAALGALLAKGPTQAVIADTEGALTAVSNGGTTTGTAKLAAATAELRVAHARAGSWWSAGGRLVPVVAQQRQALARATAAAEGLTAAASEEATKVDLHRLGYVDGHFDLARIEAMAAPVRALGAQLASTRRTLAAIRSGWLLSPIQSRLHTFGAQIDKAARSVSLATQAVTAAPGLLGGHGVRHYFVAFMTPAEARGLDGLMGSYAEITVDQGHIALTRAGPFSQLNAALPPGGGHITGVPDYMARYGRFKPQDNFEDVTYSPDLPTVTKVISELYPQAGGDHIDGVLALDPYGLAALLQFTGPVTVAGLPQPLTAANAADILVKDEYTIFAGSEGTTRHDFLQEALRQAFTQLMTTSLPGPATLSHMLHAAVRAGRLLFWSTHPSDQALLRTVGLDGAFPRDPGGDVLAVTTQNAANNKLDAYLSRTANDDITYNPSTGNVSATVTVALHNSAPSSGLPAYVLGSYAGSGLPSGTNRTWLTVYSPYSLAGATLDGAPLLMTAGPEVGVNAYSAYVNVAPGGDASVVLRLDGHLPAGGSYRLVVRSQPAALPTQEDVQFSPAGGWRVDGAARWDPAPATALERTFRLKARP